MTPRRPRSDDSGSSLIMAMMFTTGVGLVVMALLTYGLAAVNSGEVTARAAQRSADVAGALQTAINDIRNSRYNNNENEVSGIPCLDLGNTRTYAPLVASTTTKPSLPTTVTCVPLPSSGAGGGATVPINTANRPPAAVLTTGTYSSGAAAGTPPAAPSGLVANPAIGPEGTEVVVSGTNLAGASALQVGTAAELRSATGVTLSPCDDGIVAPGCFVGSGNSIRFSAPAHARGAVQVKVITVGVAATATYTYMAAPAPPSRPSVTAGNASATVAWTAPDDGGSPITGYVITPRRDGNIQPGVAVPATPTSAVLTGLTPGSSYTFTVAAVNAVGTSAPSPASTAVVPYTVPSAPAQPTATAGLGNATVAWTAPSDGGSPITGYLVTPYKAGVVQTAIPVGPSPSTVIGSLTAGISYTFTVTAVTVAGNGPASPASAAVTPYAVPSAPSVPTATAGLTSATVTWTAPSDGFTPITGYVIRTYKNTVLEQTLYPGPILTRTYTGLTAGASYTFTVAAQNAGGTGPFSPASAAVVPYAPGDYAGAVGATSGLLSYWRLGETSPTQPAADSKGTNPGTYVNSPTLSRSGAISGDPNTAATFDGIDDYVTVPRQIANDFSIEFWFSSTQGIGTGENWWQGAGLVDAEVNGPTEDFGVSLRADGRVVAGVGTPDVNIISTTAGHNDGTWHHVVFTRTQATGELRLYIDGATAGTATGSTAALTTSPVLNFGRIATGGNYYAGSLDDISVSTTAMTPGTVLDHYRLGTAPPSDAQPTATAGLARATVTWTAPSGGGSPITGYVVTPYKAGVAQTTVSVAATPTTTTITGLTVGSSYTFAVAAVSAAGTGRLSAQSNAVVPYAVPNAPAQPTATAGINSATVTWAAPYDGASAITGYVVTPYRAGVAQTPITVAATPTTATLTGLTAGASYTFTVAATNVGGTGPGSAPSAAVVPYTSTSAPAQPTATAGPASATVSWTAPYDGGNAITGYLITPFRAGIAQSATLVGATPTTRTLSGLTVGASYTFTVAAVNAAGTGPASVPSAAVVPYALPDAPAKPTATAGVTSATVSWTAPFDGGRTITGYVITPYRAGVAQTTVSVGATPTSATINGLTAGTAYTFTVAAVNAIGTGVASVQSDPVTPYTVPSAPAQPTATAGVASATVTWTSPANGGSPITGYVITPYRAGVAQTAISVGATPTTATINGLTVGAAYTFTVAAVNTAGTGAASTQSAAVTPYTTPGTPATPTATAGRSSATLSWTAPSNGSSPITGYVITPYLGTTAQTPITVGASPTTANITGLTVGGSYRFTVAAVNAAGTGPASPQSAAVVPYAVVPGAPATPTAVAGAGSATVSWSAPADNGDSSITGYVITPYRAGVAQTAVTVAATPTSRTFSGLSVGVAYTFTVAARNVIGTGPASAQSNAVTPYTVPGAPAAPTASAGRSSATVNWTAPTSNGGSAITGYSITPYRAGVGQTPIVVGASPTSRTITGLSVGVSYTFTVAAINAAGTGPASAASAAVVPFAVVPSAPTNVVLTAGTQSVTIRWTAPPDDGDSPINGYIAEGEFFSNGTWSPLGTQTFDSTATTQTVTGIPAGYIIRVRIRARNAVGTGPLSAVSNTVTVNAAPVLTFPSPLPAGRVGTAYSQTLTSTDGTTPFVWAVASGTLPPGIALNASTGVLAGNPTTTGTFTFTIRLTDSSGFVATRSTSILIQARSPQAISYRPSHPAPRVDTDVVLAIGPATPFDTAPVGYDGTGNTRPEPLLAARREPWLRLAVRRGDGRPRGQGARRARSRSARRTPRGYGVAVAAAMAMVASVLVVLTPGVASADGSELFNQPFHDNSTEPAGGAVALPRLASGGTNSACLTASGSVGSGVLTSCSGDLDTPGNGTMRLTNAAANQAGGVFAASSMPISLGLDVTFNMYQYGGAGIPADGIAMTVAAVDPAVPVSPNNIGQVGGALGYTPSGSTFGLSHGYMGFGFDVYGNFSNMDYQGRDCYSPPYLKWKGLVPGQVVIRGPGHELAGYCAINSTATTSSPVPPVVPIRAETRALSKVPVEVVINPSARTLTTASGIVSLPNTYQLVFTPVGAATRTLTGSLPTVPAGLYPKRWLNPSGYPKQLAFGWVGSTGAKMDFHEIADARVSTLSPLPAPALVVGQTAYSASTPVPGDPVTYAVTAGIQPGTAEPVPVTVTETLPLGVVPVAAYGTDWECDPPTGQTISCVNTNVPFPAGSTLPPLTITAIVTASGVTPANIQTNSIVSASSRDAETVYGGEAGWRNAGAAPLRASGPIYSNSTIASAGEVPACTGGWPLPAGTTDCNGIYVNGSVTAEKACTGRIVTAPASTVACNTNTHTTAGNDPAIAAPAAYAQPVTGMVAQRLPTCTAEPIVAFTPGYYDDAVGLSALTSGATACNNKTFWFQPGVYYFDFHNVGMPTNGSPAVPNGPNVWTFKDVSSVIVGGQQALAGKQAAWPGAGLTAANLPGACVSPLKSTTALGVQFVFGGDSRLAHEAGSIELCGSYSATRPPIVISGATGAGGSAVSTAPLRPSSLAAVKSAPETAPTYTPVTSAAPLATPSDSNAGPTVTALPASSTASFQINNVDGGVPVPARSVLESATVTVTHGEMNAAAGTTMQLVYKSTRPGSTPIVKQIPLSRTTSMTYSTQVIDFADELAAEVYAYDAVPFTLDVVLTTSAAAQSVTSTIDYMKLDIAWKTTSVRAQSGCTITVNGCATLSTTSAGVLVNELYVQGTVHLPRAKVAIAVRATEAAVFPDGVIARAFVLESDAYAGTEVYDGILIRVPDYGQGANPLQVYLTAWTCASTACVDPPPSSGWTTAGRTLVTYTDADPSQPVVGQRNVFVNSWQLTR